MDDDDFDYCGVDEEALLPPDDLMFAPDENYQGMSDSEVVCSPASRTRGDSADGRGDWRTDQSLG